MTQVVELQTTYWGRGIDTVIPAHMLFSIAANGGHVLAAMHGENLAGTVIGLLGTNPHINVLPVSGNLHIYSKRMIVNADYRNLGLGSRLKFAQRDAALKQGIERVVWTFDPLLAMNAHLNIRKLGVISRTFLTNYYGTDDTGGLSPFGSSDRLYVEWEITHERVFNRVNRTHVAPSYAEYVENGAVVVNSATFDADGIPMPSGEIRDVGKSEIALVEIPANYYQIMDHSRDAAIAWREHNRQTLRALMEGGYTVIDFVRMTQDERNRVFYVLGHAA
jgi:predicted GNAT superfamily acetyltransferase